MGQFRTSASQHNVLFGSSRRPFGALIGFDIVDPAGFVAWLASALDDGVVAGERDDPAQPEPHATITVGLARGALSALGISYRWNAASTDDAYAIGMPNRADLLGDVGPAAPDEWDEGWRGSTPHIALWVSTTTADGRDALCDATLGDLSRSIGGRVVDRTAQLHGTDGSAIEHFGYRDGISQPWIAGVHDSKDSGRTAGGKLTSRGFEPLEVGEFILGHPDSSEDVFPVPDPSELFVDGTFMVVRKLEQRVLAFRRLERMGVADELVGRRKDGTPLMATRNGLNDFTYGSDPEGHACPLTAHIRRSNPRDALRFEGERATRRRLIRRGMTYGTPLPADATEDDGGRGLMFVAYNARIADQFEFVQSRWLNDGVPFKIGAAPDLIAGSWIGNGRTIIHRRGREPEVVSSEPLVVTRGGGYYFVPGMRGLQYLLGAASREA